MAGNLKQISMWTSRGFTARQESITLYLRLTRKSVHHLHASELPPEFREIFDAFRISYNQLEKEFHDGIEDHNKWAKALTSCARSLADHSYLV